MNKEKYFKIKKRSMLTCVIGMIMILITVYLVERFWSTTSSARHVWLVWLVCFVSGFMIGFSVLSNELAEEFKKTTGEEW